jgi:hypothetical protein
MGMYCVPGREATPKTCAAFKKLLPLAQHTHSGTLDWSLESMSEALLTGLCQQKGLGLEDG